MKISDKERCKNCKYLGDIYFPPSSCQDAIHLKGCFLFADGYDGVRQVMYLHTIESTCESFEEKDKQNVGKKKMLL